MLATRTVIDLVERIESAGPPGLTDALVELRSIGTDRQCDREIGWLRFTTPNCIP
jgi:hypothetical protein